MWDGLAGVYSTQQQGAVDLRVSPVKSVSTPRRTYLILTVSLVRQRTQVVSCYIWVVVLFLSPCFYSNLLSNISLASRKKNEMEANILFLLS